MWGLDDAGNVDVELDVEVEPLRIQRLVGQHAEGGDDHLIVGLAEADLEVSDPVQINGGIAVAGV